MADREEDDELLHLGSQRVSEDPSFDLVRHDVGQEPAALSVLGLRLEQEEVDGHVRKLSQIEHERISEHAPGFNEEVPLGRQDELAQHFDDPQGDGVGGEVLEQLDDGGCDL